MSKFRILLLLALTFIGCQKYPTYSERDYNAVKNGINPLSIPSHQKPYKD